MAALCWVEVYRLRPHDAPDDPEEIVILNEALGGLLKSEDPRHWVDMDSETKIGFITWLKDRMMRLQPGLITREDWEWVEVMPTKFSKDIVQKLNHYNLMSKRASRKGDVLRRRPGFLHMPSDVAYQYLSVCASQIATATSRDLAADSVGYTDAMFGVRCLGANTAAEILRAYVPENFFSMDIQRLSDFRSAMSASRLNFETEVSSLCARYTSMTSDSELDKLKEQVIELGKQRVSAVMKEYKRAKIKAVAKSIAITVAPAAFLKAVTSMLNLGIYEPAAYFSVLPLTLATLLLDR